MSPTSAGSLLRRSQGLEVPLTLQLQFPQCFAAHSVQHTPVGGAATVPAPVAAAAAACGKDQRARAERMEQDHRRDQVTNRRLAVIRKREILSCGNESLRNACASSTASLRNRGGSY